MRIEISLPTCMIRKRFQIEQVFVCEFARSKDDKILLRGEEVTGSEFCCTIPRGTRQFLVFSLSNQWPRQSLFAICVMMHEATFIADPNLIYIFILARHHTFDNEITTCSGFTTRIQRDIASHRALCTDRSRRLQLPRARLETEVHRRQRADRTNIGGVA